MAAATSGELSVLATVQEAPGASASAAAPPATRRYEALDSLRGLAACLVVLFHIPSDGHAWPLPLVQNGFLAVSFFFVLSGFVIGASYGGRLTTGYPVGKFMLLRWGRIYPLHVFMLFVLVAYEVVRGLLGISALREGAAFTGLTSPWTFPAHLVLFQGFLPHHDWNKPSWSIGVEFWAYLICALLLHSLRFKRLLPSGIIMAIPGGLYALFGRFMPFDMPSGLDQMLGCCLGFGIGLCIYDVRQLGFHLPDAPRNRLIATASELVAAACVLVAAWTFGGRTSLLIYPAFALTIWVFSSQAGYLSRLLVTPPMLLLGMLSYSIYMVHHFIEDRLLDFVNSGILPLPLTTPQEGRIVLAGDPIWCDIVTATLIILSIGVAWLTYHYVEDPARQWSRQLARRFGGKG